LRVGIGLPSAIPDARADLLVEWIERAESGPFSSIGVVDRPRYDSYDPMTVLAHAAAATARIGLVTMVVIGPLRNSAVLANEAATVDHVSGGRFTLGLAVGARAEDFAATGQPTARRGDRMTEQLASLRDFWDRKESGRLTETGWGPPVVVGGMNDASFLRSARYADGYVHGGGPPRTFERAASKMLTAWTELDRTGRPLLWAQCYFALGDASEIERARSYMLDYYAFTGPFAERIAEGLLITPQAIAQFVRGYAEAGCDELVLLPAIADGRQLERLADVLGDG
jgi:alkanesulfonate monooxygenase SsuD/methylene tetrahydromethanopterin reductase-like flavin-dependent oxidoreductase (luciferase family)